MNKGELCAKMAEMHKKFQNEVWNQTFLAVLDYVEEHGTDDDIHETVKLYLEDLCLSGAWIKDILTGHYGRHNPKYRGSLTRKIRKALGYNL